MFEPLLIEKTKREIDLDKEEIVCLITGGLGGIGLVLAEYMTQLKNYKTKLILTGRSFFPSRKDWDHWLESKPMENHICKIIKKIRKVEAKGSEVLVLSVDVSHRQKMVKQILNLAL